MRVVVIGAGAVGRSVSRELLGKGHAVTIVDLAASPARRESMAEMTWVIGDAAEIEVLSQARLEEAEVMVAATGDDKVNLVVSLLAKTEFGVPRTVARVSHPANEWMFDGRWGVDVAVSTPRIMTALVEEAVSVGRVVKIFSFAGSSTEMVEVTLGSSSPAVGLSSAEIDWPVGAVLVGVVRDGRPLDPADDEPFHVHDELLFLSEPRSQEQLQSLLAPGAEHRDELPGEETGGAARPAAAVHDVEDGAERGA